MLTYLLFILLFAIFLIKGPKRALFVMIVGYPTLQMFGTKVIPLMAAIMLLWMVLTKKGFNLKDFPWTLSFALSILSYFITFLFSNGERHIGALLSCCSYYILPYLLWFLYKPGGKGKRSDCNRITKYFMIYLSVLFIYSIYEVTYNTNPIIHYLVGTGAISDVEQSTEYVRFGFLRAQSMTTWCSAYGSACGLGMAFLLNMMTHKFINPSITFYALICCLAIGVFLCGTRTIMVMTCFALFSVLPFFVKNFKKFIPLLIFVGVMCYMYSDTLSEAADSIIHHEEAQGSSLEMREMQYAAAYKFFSRSPIVGNGLGETGQATNVSADLLGAESIIFNVLIDRGMIGAITLIVLVIQSIYILYKRKCYSLILLVLAYAFGKCMSLLPGQPETLILLYVIPLIKEITYSRVEQGVGDNKNVEKKNRQHLYR